MSGEGGADTGNGGAGGGTAEECVVGSKRPYYSGPDWTENVGICLPGIEECQVTEEGTTWQIKEKDVTPRDEICNKLDDDCDGPVNEDFPSLGKECYAGIGECLDDGFFVCTPSGLLTICDAEMLPPTEEVCDNLDNNCNGLIDDGISCCDPDKDGLITDKFKDLNFVNAVREALKKGPNEEITLENALNTTSLYLNSKGISDISGIECFTNLTWLGLTDNQIADISPLAGLTTLTELGLGNNQIVNLSPLAGLTTLIKLYLSENQIVDISPLASLIKLTRLDLDNNQISNISPLSGLIDLIETHLHNNQISDISSLAGLTKLTHLFLDYNQISNISPLANLTNLPYLYLANNKIEDLSPLEKLPELILLFLDYNLIINITPLIKNKDLGDGNQVTLNGNDQIPVDQINQLKAKGVTVYW